jgi:predicted ATPase
VAKIVETLIRASRDLRVLATSREPLRVEGESQYRLASLTIPTSVVQHSPGLLHYSAVQLFVSRATAARQDFTPDEEGLKRVATICKRLDGIPLAIELAATGAATLGLKELADRLDDRFSVLTDGHRTAMPRHQTLRATLDWSYELLTETDKGVLRRLSIFAGVFTLDAALRVAATEEVAPPHVLNSIMRLVAKSLVATEQESVETRYRLLETTRAYAFEKLSIDAERDVTARRHAEYHRDLFEHASVTWRPDNTAEWLSAYASRIEDVHAALDWAASPGKDATIGAMLAATAVPLWMELSLIDEGLRRTEKAVAALEAHSAKTKRHSMVLYAALARLQLYSVASFEACGEAWAKALRIAEELGDTGYRLHILWGAYAGFMAGGQFREAFKTASNFRNAASARGCAEELIGHRMMGNAMSRLGDQVTARWHTERMLRGYEAPAEKSHSVMFGGKQRSLARATLARILWLQGYPDQAVREMKESCELIGQDSSVLSHKLITFACPIALWVGDLPEAERYSAVLSELSAERASEMRDHADCIAGEILLARGHAEAALSLLTPAIASLRRRGAVQHLTWQLSVMARALACMGQTSPALAVLQEAIFRCKRIGEGWCRPELHRVKAEIILQSANEPSKAIERQLSAALVIARRQGARSWELRIATSLARFRLAQGRKHDALGVLKPVYDAFTEGFATADLQKAQALLKACS